jgi:GNAT superfamily N-acetyltransferase
MHSDSAPYPGVALLPVANADFDELAALRIDAMRDSLERIGRFDPQRARERFRNGFSPDHTRHIVVDGKRAGFMAIKSQDDHLLLDHLYLRPEYQGRGIGAAVLQIVFAEADAAGLPVRVGALRDSDSNRFYARHGFEKTHESTVRDAGQLLQNSLRLKKIRCSFTVTAASSR